jgi:hypothetical protein
LTLQNVPGLNALLALSNVTRSVIVEVCALTTLDANVTTPVACSVSTPP